MSVYCDMPHDVVEAGKPRKVANLFWDPDDHSIGLARFICSRIKVPFEPKDLAFVPCIKLSETKRRKALKMRVKEVGAITVERVRKAWIQKRGQEQEFRLQIQAASDRLQKMRLDFIRSADLTLEDLERPEQAKTKLEELGLLEMARSLEIIP